MRPQTKAPKPLTVEQIVESVANDVIQLIESTRVLAGLLGTQTHRQLFQAAAAEYADAVGERVLDQLFGAETA
ncbi:MAG: hypothetical protein QOH56_394 [Pseudonocardiales bacterium]|jgi:hypothetical protein|nr:hypothetical protein [Pseudonocardiales bacterium]